MKERPIIFTGQSVRDILEGRKTHSRRVIYPRLTEPKGVVPLTMEPWLNEAGDQETDDDERPMWIGKHPRYPYVDSGKWFTCDYGKPGDRLWVRETWCHFPSTAPDGMGENVYYKAGQREDTARAWKVMRDNNVSWRSPMRMPRIASRLLLELIEVRVERLQDISEEDALAEGIRAFDYGPDSYKPSVRSTYYGTEMLARGVMEQTAAGAYRRLWDSVNAKRGYDWDSNPWVWVLVFKKIDPGPEASHEVSKAKPKRRAGRAGRQARQLSPAAAAAGG